MLAFFLFPQTIQLTHGYWGRKVNQLQKKMCKRVQLVSVFSAGYKFCLSQEKVFQSLIYTYLLHFKTTISYCLLEMWKYYLPHVMCQKHVRVALLDLCLSILAGLSMPQVFQCFLVSDPSETSICSSLCNSALNYLLTQCTQNLISTHLRSTASLFSVMMSRAFPLHLATYSQRKYRKTVLWTHWQIYLNLSQWLKKANVKYRD